MKKNSGVLKLFGQVVLLMFLSLTVMGEQQKSTRPVKPSSHYPFSAEPFTGGIPPHFQGFDLRKIETEIAISTAKKGEFETTSQYLERINRASTEPFSNGIPKNSPLVLVFPTEESIHAGVDGNIKTAYDADLEVFKISLGVASPNDAEESSRTREITMVWGKNAKSSSPYSAMNSYGAVVKVTAVISKQEAISFPVDSMVFDKVNPGLGSPLAILVPVKADRAQILKGRLRVLVICRVADDIPVSEAGTFHSATVEAPAEISDSYQFLHVTPSEYWVFDSDTGEILAKTTPLKLLKRSAEEKGLSMATSVLKPGSAAEYAHSSIADELAREAVANPWIRDQVIENGLASNKTQAAAASKSWELAHREKSYTDQEFLEAVKSAEGSACLIITSPGGAQVEVDGLDAGKTPVGFVLMRHKDAPRAVSIKMDGYEEIHQQFVPDGQDIVLNVKLKKVKP